VTAQRDEVAYKRCYGSLMSLDNQSIIFCSMALDVAIKEARALVRATVEDRQVLINAGVDHTIIDSLADRVDAFAYAVDQYHTATTIDPIALRQWNQSRRKGYETRNYLIRFLNIAFRDQPELLLKIDQRTGDGQGHQDMLESLLILSSLAESNAELLRAIPLFDTSKIYEARKLYISLSELLNRACIDQEKVTEAKNILNRAYTLYHQAAGEIRIVGQYLFQGTSRVRLYSSNAHSSHPPGNITGSNPKNMVGRSNSPHRSPAFPDDDFS
jgi:hypothetical protein